ncbi:hypothetical protein ACET3Z_023852 [Daucus carota]
MIFHIAELEELLQDLLLGNLPVEIQELRLGIVLVQKIMQKGTFDAEEKAVKLRSELVGNAAKVKDITRTFKLVDGELTYEVEMATGSVSLQPHLKASLKKL